MPSGIRKIPISITCLHCGVEFEWYACTTVKYCSSSCRQKFGYWRDVDTRRERNRNRREQYREDENQRRREKRAANPEQAREKARLNYLKNPAPKREAALKWQRENPDRVAMRFSKRKAREAGYVISPRDLSRQLSRQRGECYYCGVRLREIGRAHPDNLNWDHVLPLSLGGRHSKGNLVASCRTCNLRKGARFAFEWRLRLLRDR